MCKFGDLIRQLAGRTAGFRTALKAVVIATGLMLTCVGLSPSSAVAQAASPPSAGASAQAKAVGAIKSISGNSLILTTDDGKSFSVSLPDTVHIVRIAPGQTDLKGATAITPQDLQVDDRILVRGKASDDARSLTASTVMVMKQSDVAAKQQQEREDWQKRGIGGLVSAVDPAAGTVTISVTTLAGSKKVLVGTSKKTTVRRYAPNSVKFDDAKPSKLADIYVGDQLRARGNKNAEGTEFAAEEIVTGSFRNIAGTVTLTDAAANSLTLTDVITKKTVVVKVTPDSQLRKLPQMMAQRIAMRLKGQTPDGQPSAAGAPANTATAGPAAGSPSSGPGGGSIEGAASAPGAYGGGNGRGGGDLQQMLSRLPAVTVNDFQKGDAVILVSTQGTDSEVTAITLVGGVEPILTAAPAGGQAMAISPWTLGAGTAEAAAQ